MLSSRAIATVPSLNRMKMLGILMVLISSVGIGIAPTFAKFALNAGSNTFTLVAMRNLIMVCLIAAYFLISGTKPHIGRKPLLISLAMGPVYIALGYGYLGSVAYISVSLAIVIYFLHPLLIAIVSRVLGHEAISGRQILATLLALVGLALSIGFSVGAIDARGVLLALMSAGACTVMILSNSYAMQKTPSVVVIFYMVLCATLVYGSIGLVSHSFVFPVNRSGWVGIVGVGLGYTVGILTFFWAVPILGAFRATMISTTEPLFGIVCAVVLLGNKVSLLQVLGTAMLVAAIIAVEVDAMRRKAST